MVEMISNTREAVKKWWTKNNDSIFWGITLFLIIILGAGILRLWIVIGTKPPVRFIDSQKGEITQEILHQRYIQASGLPGLVAASRNGKRYYYPWCGGIKQIKEKNLMWFTTKEEAERAGYTVAKGCEGL